MLKKFLVIKSVGRFEDYAHRGDIEFRKFNLLHAENGRGKTTLSHIMRSLATGDTKFIAERSTLTSIDNPHVQILLDTGIVTLKNGQWNKTLRDIEIFDTTYVNENVFSGYYVGVDHRRNLYEFVIGDNGIKLRDLVNQYGDQIKQCNAEIKDKKSDIEMVIKSDFSVDDFANLKPVSDIDQQIDAQQREVGALEKANEIIKKTALVKIVLPHIDEEALVALLGKQLEDVNNVAMEQVQQHINKLGKKSEAWISEGFSLQHDANCPYCGQTTTGTELITAYQSFFSSTYTSLKVEVARYTQKIAADFSERELLTLTNTAANNDEKTTYWSNFLDLKISKLNVEQLQTAWNEYVAGIKTLLEYKKSLPLEQVNVGAEFEYLKTNYHHVIAMIADYNFDIEINNNKIEELKTNISSGDLVAEQIALKKLEDIRKRFEPKVDETCNAYLAAKNKKSSLEREKEKARTDLEQYTEKTLGVYAPKLNEYLEKFGASFKIEGNTTSFSGGKPSIDYEIVLDGKTMPLGKPDEQDGTPTFKTLLSDGDKNTLAFALFMARLETMNNTELANKVIVFDDPISSLDNSRKQTTRQSILAISQKAKQVIILSHDPNYLRMAWDNCDKAITRTLQITRSGTKSQIEVWDIEEETKEDYFRNYDTLQNYKGGASVKEMHDVARCIRLLLEANLRMRFPSAFKSDEWLGDFVGKIRDAATSDELHMLKPHLTEYSDVNDYSKKYHHSQNPSADSESITDAELQTYISRTLKLIGGV